MKIKILGIDLAKDVFQLHGIDAQNNTVLKKRLTRKKLLPYLSNLSLDRIVMEACGGANYWARQFSKQGYQVKLISPQYVKPFVKTNKNDENDAQAIVEAGSRPSMHFVSVKQIAQQDIQSLHRIRSRLLGHRTALSNQIRGLLAEYGIVLRKGMLHLRKRLPEILEDGENELTLLMRETLQKLFDEMKHFDEHIKHYDKQLAAIYAQDPVCQRLGKIEGMGVLTTTALVAAVGDPRVFKNGRQMSAWLGLVPRQYASGKQSRLLGITKRGDNYLRQLFIHGARSVVYRANGKTDKRSEWINNLQLRGGTNKTSVAIANKNVRIAWALMVNKSDYYRAA